MLFQYIRACTNRGSSVNFCSPRYLFQAAGNRLPRWAKYGLLQISLYILEAVIPLIDMRLTLRRDVHLLRSYGVSPVQHCE